MVFLLADRTRLADDLQAGRQQQRPGIGDPVRLQLFDLARQPPGSRHPSGTSASIVSTRSSCSAESAAAAPLFKPASEGGEADRELSLSPAAAACPPKAISPSEQSLSASYRSNPGIDRAEPCEIVVAQSDDHGRPMKRLRQSAGDDADHPRVPALSSQHDRPAVAQAPLGLEHLLGFVKDLAFDLLAPLVAAIEQERDLVAPAPDRRS